MIHTFQNPKYDIWISQIEKHIFFYKYEPTTTKYVYRSSTQRENALLISSSRINVRYSVPQTSDGYYIYQNIPKDIINNIIRQAIIDDYTNLLKDDRGRWINTIIKKWLNGVVCPDLKVI